MRKGFPKQVWAILTITVGLVAFAYLNTPSVTYVHSDLVAEHVISSDSLTPGRHFDTLCLDSVLWLVSKINQSKERCQAERLNEGAPNDSLKLFNAKGFNKKFFCRDFMNNRPPQEYNRLVNVPVHAFEKDIHLGFCAPVVKVDEVNYVILPFDIVASFIEQYGKRT